MEEERTQDMSRHEAVVANEHVLAGDIDLGARQMGATAVVPMVEKPWGRRSKHRTTAVNTTAAVPDNRWPCRGSGNSIAYSSPQNDEEVTPVVMIGPPETRGCVHTCTQADG